MKINILLCDRFPGLLPEYIPSYEWMFMDLFSRNCKEDVEYEVFPVMEGVYPAKVNTEDIYLVTGSNNGVYDDIEWVKNLLGWIRMAYREQLKVVGICFGHQAVAQALGGKVEKAPQGWGTGIRVSTIEGEEAREWFADGKLKLMYNHHDQVVELPPRAVRFATSNFCPNDGFYVGDNIITFQGHPEYDPCYNVHLIMDFADDEPQEVKDAALRSIGDFHHQGDIVARWLLSRYFK